MNQKSTHLRKLALTAVIAALYAALTIFLAPISYGAIQCRVSEVLCILPYFFPWASWGLFIGCLLANLYTATLMDIIFGSLATLLAALCTAALGRRNHTMGNSIFACAMPVLFNAVIVGAVLTWAYGITWPYGGILISYLINALSVGVGEAAVLYILGLPLMRNLPKAPWWKKYSSLQ